MRDTAGEVGAYSCGPSYVDEQWQDAQLAPTYNSSLPIQDVALPEAIDDIEGRRDRVREIPADCMMMMLMISM